MANRNCKNRQDVLGRTNCLLSFHYILIIVICVLAAMGTCLSSHCITATWECVCWAVA
jgi:hypothetical protein